MRFIEKLAELRLRCRHGELVWHASNPLSAALAGGCVPNEPGVYVLSVQDGKAAGVVYVGRAGTICADGSFKEQGLIGRLQAKQDGVRREKYFRTKLLADSYGSLRIEWFVTWDNETKLAPAAEEARLLEAFLLDFGRLPEWNRTF